MRDEGSQLLMMRDYIQLCRDLHIKVQFNRCGIVFYRDMKKTEGKREQNVAHQ